MLPPSLHRLKTKQQQQQQNEILHERHLGAIIFVEPNEVEIASVRLSVRRRPSVTLTKT